MRATTLYGSVFLLAAVAACGKRDTVADTTAMDSSANVAAPMDSGSLGAPLSTANIAAMIELTNETEIDMGKMAADKATNADVKAFAKQMVTDHEALQKSIDSVTSAINVSPNEPAQAEAMKQSAENTKHALDETAKGAAFDKAYIDAQVSAHQQAVNDLQNFSASTTDMQLKAAIDGAIPKVQAHLDRAREIQTKLGG